MSESVKLSSALKGDYYLLNTSKIPSVIVECGFLSNEHDEKLLTTKNYQVKLCSVIFEGVNDYLKAKYSV